MKNQITDKSHFTVCPIALRRRSFKLTVYDDFFKDDIVCKITNDSIIFSKPKLSDRKNILSPHNAKYGAGDCFSITGDLDIKTGSYNFEEVEDDDFRIFLL